jgi:hypothetical protein
MARRLPVLELVSILAALVLAQRQGVREAESHPAPEETRRDPLAELRILEETARGATDFAALPTGDRVTGANPADLAPLPGRTTVAAVLRGRDALVLLDAGGAERQRLPLPGAPRAVAAGEDGTVYAAASASTVVARFRARPDGRLEPAGALPLGGVAAVTDLAVGPEGVVYAVEDYGGRLLALAPAGAAGGTLHEFGRCHGPSRVTRADRLVLVDCFLDHEIRLYPTDDDGLPATTPAATLRFDGPIWSLAATRAGDRLVVALGGVEDHPLVRADGAFYHIDSVVTVVELDLPDLAERSRRVVDASALGVVTPKWIAVEAWPDGSVEVAAAGYASDRRVTLRFAPGASEPAVESFGLPPGTVAMVRRGDAFLAANTLLDALVVGEKDLVTITPVAAGADEPPAPPRSTDARVGELLFFTTMLAPWNTSDGARSRFTCETCHHEGYGDGRVHSTGRGAVRATARPLRGLGNNRPYFSRALDRTMADMVHAELRVANAGSGRSDWFALDAGIVPWLAQVPGLPRLLGPLALRRGFMVFLMGFTHEPNPAVVAAGPRGFTEVERRGAELFRDHCEPCHAARLVADEPASRVPYERWESLVMAPAGAIVWGSEAYHRTGVEPYVHERGARVPSLRRVYRRYPLFTNGSAADLGAVLARARRGPGGFRHDAPDGDAFGADERVELEAFLRLL